MSKFWYFNFCTFSTIPAKSSIFYDLLMSFSDFNFWEIHAYQHYHKADPYQMSSSPQFQDGNLIRTSLLNWFGRIYEESVFKINYKSVTANKKFQKSFNIVSVYLLLSHLSPAPMFKSGKIEWKHFLPVRVGGTNFLPHLKFSRRLALMFLLYLHLPEIESGRRDVKPIYYSLCHHF